MLSLCVPETICNPMGKTIVKGGQINPRGAGGVWYGGEHFLAPRGKHSDFYYYCNKIFAGVLQSHYHWITPIVKQTCAEFGIKYNGADTFKDVLSLHFSYLKKMGSGHHHHHDNNQDG